MAILITSIVAGLLGGLVLWFILYHRVGLKYLIHQDWFSAEFVGEEKAFARTFRSKEADHEFTIKVKGKLHTYGKLRECMVPVTKFNIPKSYYVIGRYEPLNMKTMSVNSEVSAIRYSELERNTVVRDLMNAFKSQKIDTTSALLIMCGVTILGLVILGYFLNDKIEKLMT